MYECMYVYINKCCIYWFGFGCELMVHSLALIQYFSGGSLTPQEPMTCGNDFLFLSEASLSISSFGAVGLNWY